MMMKEITALLQKELMLEWRQKYALSGILLYVISTVFVCYLSFKRIVDVPTWNALFWIIILFASVNAVTKSFTQETQGRLLYLYTLSSPRGVILAKTIYNMGLISLLSLVSYLFYGVFIGDLVQDQWLFILSLIIGSCGLSGVLTLMSAIASKTNNNVTLMAILSFPIVLPLMMCLIILSKNAIDGLAWSVSWKYIVSLFSLDVIVIVLSYLLFPYLWRD